MQTALTDGRNLAYDCQDVIETYMLQVADRDGYEHYEGCQLGSALRWARLLRKAIAVHKLRSQIDHLDRRISALKSSLVSYGILVPVPVNPPVESHEHVPRRIYTHEREEDVVVGLEADVEELVGRLVNADDRTVISICGMGGVGKSTLARELYHHPMLRGDKGFKAFGWATASQQFQLKRVLRKLMYSLVPESSQHGRRRRRRKIEEDMSADHAYATLYALMRQVKCLVVVDDIWTSNAWDALQHAFPRISKAGSRVVLTTRNKDILSSSALDRIQVHLHPMKGLSKSNSWKLFENITFPGTTCSGSTKEALGREMLKWCKGVPLAILVLGKVLKRKDKEDDWIQMHNDMLAHIHKGGALDSPYKQVHDVLEVSYDELPFHLKPCFLQLAIFPEDYEIPTVCLFQLWVGEGIVSKESHADESEEEIAERYLNDLVSMNMVQVEKRWVNGSVRSFRVHDLMRDVCIGIAKREGFIHMVKCHKLTSSSNIITDADNLLMTCLPKRDKTMRRLAVYMSDGEEHSSNLLASTSSASGKTSRAPNLRSLVFFSVHGKEQQSDDLDCKRLMKTICKDYTLLRVMDCRLVYVSGKLPREVGNLIHLRYLSLINTRITEVPSSIAKLQQLQTLDLMVHPSVEELTIPNVLWKMKQLRHLMLPEYKSPFACTNKEEEKWATGSDLQRYSIKGGGVLRLDGQSNLQTLVCIDLDRVDLRDLSTLKSLKWLTASCETKKKALDDFMKCSRIRTFKFRVHAQIINEDPGIFSTCEAMDFLEIYVDPCAKFQLKQPLQLPNSLVALSIYYAKLVDDPLPVLEQLPNLRILNLIMCYDGVKMVCSAGGFPQITHLRFDGLSNFSQWEVKQGALEKLENLYIYDCPLTNIPNVLPSSVNVNIQ